VSQTEVVMDSRKKRVVGFLQENGMYHENIDMDMYCSSFIDEMERGLSGKASSLQMIPTYIDAEKEIPLNKPVIALDAGGTNFRVATVYFDGNGQPVIERFKKFRMPGVERELGKQEFFQTIADYVRDVMGSSNRIGFCFSYPAEILPNRDGRLTHFTKEVKAEEVVGELIGENLLGELRRRGLAEELQLVLLNDTTATLLAGKSATAGRFFDSYIGFILGTGTNSCYIEKNRNITKVYGLDPGRNQIINVESGGFGRGPRGRVDLEFDKTTVDPGGATFEKMISGAYFGMLTLHTMRCAAADGVFTKEFVGVLEGIPILNSSEITRFLRYPYEKTTVLGDGIRNEDDRVTLFYLIDQLIVRAAKLTAVNLSSVVLKGGGGSNPCSPVCITADGSMFHGLVTLKERINCFIRRFLVDGKDRFYEFTQIDNASLIGAAIAGLTN